MFVRTKTTPNSPRKSIQIVEGYRDAKGKVKQKIIRHVGIALDESEEAKLKALAHEIIEKIELERAIEASKNSLFPMKENDKLNSNIKRPGRPRKKGLEEVIPVNQVTLDDIVEEKRIVEGIHDIAGDVFDDMYRSLCHRNRLSKHQYARLRDVVLGRLANPCSKHKIQTELKDHFDKPHHLDALYRMMDKTHDQIDMIKSLTFSKTQNLFPEGVDVLLFDVTTLYFESVTTDDLRTFGYSKDHRFNTTQVVLALATNSDGLPVGYELFSGNKAEVKTLVESINAWRKIFPIDRVCFVGDRAMMSHDNISLLESLGHEYIIAAKLKLMPKVLQEKILDQKHYHPCLLDQALNWVGEFEHQGQRLLVSYKHERAQKDANDRQKILDKLTKQLGTGKQSRNLITNAGVKQYVKMEKTTASIDEEKVASASRWDGLHGVITNIKEAQANEIIARYSRLWRIEESFRINKHTLQMRPIFHFKPERIKAHIAICYMAFSVLRHIEYQVNLRQKLSINKILDTLRGVQASIYIHKKTKDRYRVPGLFTTEARRIYKAFDKTRSIDAEVYLY